MPVDPTPTHDATGTRTLDADLRPLGRVVR